MKTKIPIPSFFDNDDQQIHIGDTVDISVQRIHDNYEKIYRGVVMRRGKRYFVKVKDKDYLFEIIDPMLCTVINEKEETSDKTRNN